MQRFADETGLRVSVCHYPPGTSKWNKSEHRLFSAIAQGWRGRPLQTVVECIAATDTVTGLRVRAAEDRASYPKGIKVTDREMAGLALRRASFHGDWNYTLLPRL